MRVEKQGRSTGLKIVVGLYGMVFSVLLHELLHVLMHWGQVTHVSILPGNGAIAEIAATMPAGYDVAGEEMAAYMITLVTILITVAIICKIHDKTDRRSGRQLLEGNEPELQALNTAELFKLAQRIGVL